MAVAQFKIHSRFADFTREYGFLMRKVERAVAGPGLPRAEARILLEIYSGPKTAAQLVTLLAMDRGQLSMSIKHLEDKGFLFRGPPDFGSKSQVIELTKAGKNKASEALARQDREVDRVEKELPPLARDRFLYALRRLEEQWSETVGYSGPVFRDAETGDLSQLAANLVVSNATDTADDRLGSGWEAHVLRMCAEFAAHPRPGINFIRLAECQGSVISSIMMSAEKKQSKGQIRHLWTHHHFRGQGCGTQLVEDCILRARKWRYSELTATLPASHWGPVIFDKLGWTQVDASAGTKFGRRHETWTLRL